MKDFLELKAYGKINLGLDVLRRREDGYHEVSMIMQTVGIYDKITIGRNQEHRLSVKTSLPFIPDGPENLAYRAADLLLKESGRDDGISISIRKVIPVAAGMAGGSTDAAAVMVGVNRLLKLGYTTKELMELGVKLGADVPYCILRGTALSEGIGEILTPLPPVPACHLLIVKPSVSVSTKAVYENLHVNELPKEAHPDIKGMTEAIRQGDLDGIISRLGNILETVTIPAHPVIGRIKEAMMEHGASGALMSGSGPTVFGMFKDRREAIECQNFFLAQDQEKLAKQIYVTEFFNKRSESRRGKTNDK